MPHRGQIVIAAIFLAAIVAGAVAIVYHRGRAARPLELWGRDAALRIVQAPRVAALKLAPDDSAPDAAGIAAGESIEVDGRRYLVRQRREITGARGLVNIRRALVDDATFDWQDVGDDCLPDWSDALEFSDDSGRVIVLFSFDCPRVRSLPGEAQASIGPTAAALRAFMAEQFAPDAP
jgi:hypothetical protein